MNIRPGDVVKIITESAHFVKEEIGFVERIVGDMYTVIWWDIIERNVMWDLFKQDEIIEKYDDLDNPLSKMFYPGAKVKVAVPANDVQYHLTEIEQIAEKTTKEILNDLGINQLKDVIFVV